MPTDWCTQPALRRQGCRQRLSFASLLHARLCPVGALDAATELPTDILHVIGAATLRDHPSTALAVQLRSTGDWLGRGRGRLQLRAEPEPELAASAAGCAGRPGGKACSMQ